MTKKHAMVMLIIAFVMGINTTIYSQKTQQDFEKAVGDYNNACEKLKTSEAEYAQTLQTDKLDNVLTEFKEIMQFLLVMNNNLSVENAIKSPTAYYAMLCQLKSAHIYLNYFYSSEMAYAILKELAPFMNGEKNWNLPFDYSYDGMRYTVTDKNFNDIGIVFYQLMGDACNGMKKNNEMIDNYTKLLALKNLSAVEKAIPLNNIIAVVQQKENQYSNSEYIKYLSLFIQNYADLTRDEKIRIESDTSIFTYPKALKTIVELAENQELASQDIAQLAVAINTLTRSDISSKALPALYKSVIKKYISTKVNVGRDNDYYLQSSPFQMLIKAEMYARVVGKNDADLGLLATNAIAQLAIKNNDCEYMQVAADNFMYWGKPQEAKTYKAMVAPCKAKLKRAEAKRIAEQKRANSTFNLYVGTYPFLLFKNVDTRDYGAVLNFVTKKSAIEFSFLQIQQNKNFNKENYWKPTLDPLKEMSLWDGFYAHAQFKQFGKAYGSTNYYQGYLLGMASKKYNPMQVDITEISTNQVTSTTFNASEKQYIAMYNFGTMFLFKGIGVDAYCGVGGTYNMFDQGAVVDKALYSIQNTSLQLNKPTSFGFIFRVGLTVGLNIGNGNMR
jgi:hypothetical protein